MVQRKRVVVCLTLMLAAAGCATAPDAGASPCAELRSCVRLTEDSVEVSSGTVCAGGGRMYTAAHVVSSGGWLEVDGVDLDVLAMRQVGDLAEITVRELPAGLINWPLARAPAWGEPVEVWGYLGGVGLVRRTGWALSPGRAAVLVGCGMSGGPVICRGRLVGVVSAAYPELGIASYCPAVQEGE